MDERVWGDGPLAGVKSVSPENTLAPCLATAAKAAGSLAGAGIRSAFLRLPGPGTGSAAGRAPRVRETRFHRAGGGQAGPTSR